MSIVRKGRVPEIGAYQPPEYLPHIIRTKRQLMPVLIGQMGHHSQAALTLGRRPSTMVSTRGTRTLAVATPSVCSALLREAAARFGR